MLPQKPGLQRRLAYGELIRKKRGIPGAPRLYTREHIDEYTYYNVDIDIANIQQYLTENRGNSDVTDNQGLSVKDLRRNSSIKNISQEIFCSICQDTCTQTTVMYRELVCQHTFHIDCIDNWLSLKTTCPLCNFDLSKN
jgi:hypothetical protein